MDHSKQGVIPINKMMNQRSQAMEQCQGYDKIGGPDDEGVAQVAKLPALATLNLWKTTVSDDCIDSLTKIKTLKSLNIESTRITPDGAAKLKAAMPSVNIKY